MTGDQGYCVFRDLEWPSFSILPTSCVAKSLILQSLQLTSGVGNHKHESVVKLFGGDLRDSSLFTCINFSPSETSLQFKEGRQDIENAYALVPRTIAVQTYKSNSKPKLKQTDLKPSAVQSKEPKHTQSSIQGTAPIVEVAKPATQILKSSNAEHVASDHDAEVGTAENGKGISAKPVVLTTAGAVKQVQNDQLKQTPANLGSGKQPLKQMSEKGCADAGTLSAESDTKQANPPPKDCNKKRKDPPPAEDLSPAYWEKLVKDGGIQKATVPAMKQFLSSVKLPVSGKKELLIERIKKHFNL